MKYYFNRKSRYKFFYKIIGVYFLLGISIVILFLMVKDITDEKLVLEVSILGMIPILLLYFSPLVVLYINHKNKSLGVSLEIKQNSISYTKFQLTKEFLISDISQIELVLSPPIYEDRIDWFYFGVYHYWVIYYKNEKYKVSCLLCDKSEVTFPDNLVKKKKKIFPIM